MKQNFMRVHPFAIPFHRSYNETKSHIFNFYMCINPMDSNHWDIKEILEIFSLNIFNVKYFINSLEKWSSHLDETIKHFICDQASSIAKSPIGIVHFFFFYLKVPFSISYEIFERWQSPVFLAFNSTGGRLSFLALTFIAGLNFLHFFLRKYFSPMRSCGIR